MAERRARHAAFEVCLDYRFDRLLESKLAQAYDILVPSRERLIGRIRAKETEHEDGRNLRPSVLGETTRGTHDCEPDSGADPVRPNARAGSAERVDVRRRRLERRQAGKTET